MKLKARDIVPGWPRGRSSSSSFVSNLWQYADFLKEMSFWTAYHMFGVSPDTVKYLISNAEYHQQQQKMVDEFRKGISRREWFPEQRLMNMAGVVGKAFGFDFITPGRENCPLENIGRKFGAVIGGILEGPVLDPNYCIVNSEGKCVRHSYTTAYRRENCGIS